MSLNRTEKNNRDYVNRLILETENVIVEESRKWLASSVAIKNDKDKVEDKDNDIDEGKKKAKDEEVKIKN